MLRVSLCVTLAYPLLVPLARLRLVSSRYDAQTRLLFGTLFAARLEPARGTVPAAAAHDFHERPYLGGEAGAYRPELSIW